jgi:hypothetical protein
MAFPYAKRSNRVGYVHACSAFCSVWTASISCAAAKLAAQVDIEDEVGPSGSRRILRYADLFDLCNELFE